MHPVKNKLDKVSPSFCAAKWLQVTVRLQNGHTHSCHHPKTHKVSADRLKDNPSELHNTDIKKTARKMMLEGQRPPECSYCWKVEDLPGNQISDRFHKSADSWSEPYLETLARQPWDADVVPKYLEVSFSNVCNFKCAYCFPDVSSKWMSEILEHGPYPTSDYFGSLVYLQKEGTLPLPEEKNPYLTAFWKWLPDIISELHVLRVTGGEPLLSKDCRKLLEFMEQNPNPKLELSINTNLGVPGTLVTAMLTKLKSLKTSGKIKEAQIFTSIDTWGDQAEYIRFGLDLELWKRNLQLCLEQSEYVKTNIMITFNALSVFRFKELLEFVLMNKKAYRNQIVIDISILHNPVFLSLQISGDEYLHKINDCLFYMKQNISSDENIGFYDYEISKMERLLEFAKQSLSNTELKKRRIDFVAYVNEYDRRKKTDFLKTFPEMRASLTEWKKFLKERPVMEKLRLEIFRRGQKSIGNKLMSL